ncbi:MAG: putative selenate reductase FAD-binding subunit [Clostridiales bacterium]|nr:putative selenate reductase FAD-binding subunit [Clostridiales bacterium]
MNVKEFLIPETLEEAVALLSVKRNRLIGGNHWMKQNKQIINAVSLDLLDLNYILETENEIQIGGTTPLREIERNQTIKKYFPHIAEAYEHIVGVQLRNTATIGASIYSRFGFSDTVSTLLLLDTEIEINGSERIPLEQYVNRTRTKEIITKVIIKKETVQVKYYAQRKSGTDLPFLIMGLSKCKNEYKVVCAARPKGATLLKETSAALQKEGFCDAVGEKLLAEAAFESNGAASESYRRYLAQTLLKRGWESLCY